MVSLKLAESVSCDIITKPSVQEFGIAKFDDAITRAADRKESVRAFERMAFGKFGVLGLEYISGRLRFEE